jgi:hypothetical protein
MPQGMPRGRRTPPRGVDHRRQTRLIQSKLHPSALESEVLEEGDTEMSNFAKRSLAALLEGARIVVARLG